MYWCIWKHSMRQISWSVSPWLAILAYTCKCGMRKNKLECLSFSLLFCLQSTARVYSSKALENSLAYFGKEIKCFNIDHRAFNYKTDSSAPSFYFTNNINNITITCNKNGLVKLSRMEFTELIKTLLRSLLAKGLRRTKCDKNWASTDLFKRIKLALIQEDQLDNSLTSTQVK